MIEMRMRQNERIYRRGVIWERPVDMLFYEIGSLLDAAVDEYFRLIAFYQKIRTGYLPRSAVKPES